MKEITILENSELTQKLLPQLSPILKEVQEHYDKQQVFRTKTEMVVSVLNDVKFPTPDAKYWQAIREQSVMFSELIRLSFEYRRNLVKMEKLKVQIASEQNELDKQLLEIDLEEKRFIRHTQEKIAKERVREILEWQDIIKQQEKRLKAGTKSPNDHQLLSYTRRFIEQRIAMGKGGSPAERQNLLGQLQTALKECAKRGLLEEAIKPFNETIKANIRSEYGNHKILHRK